MGLKERFVESLRQQFAVSRADAVSIYNLFCSICREELLKVGRLKLPSVFTLHVKPRAPRRIPNFHGGPEILLPGGKRLVVNATGEFKQSLDAQAGEEGESHVS